MLASPSGNGPSTFTTGDRLAICLTSSLRVHLLWHQHDPDDDDTAMLLGVDSTRERAETRIASAKLAPDFRRFPDACTVAAARALTHSLTCGASKELKAKGHRDDR